MLVKHRHYLYFKSTLKKTAENKLETTTKRIRQ